MTMKTENWLRFVRNPQTLIVYLRNVYIRHVTIKVCFYLQLRFACRLCSCSGAFLTIASNSSQPTGSEPLSLISVLHRCSFLKKTFTVLITNHAVVVGENSSGNEACVSLRTHCNQVCDTVMSSINSF